MIPSRIETTEIGGFWLLWFNVCRHQLQLTMYVDSQHF